MRSARLFLYSCRNKFSCFVVRFAIAENVTTLRYLDGDIAAITKSRIQFHDRSNRRPSFGQTNIARLGKLIGKNSVD